MTPDTNIKLPEQPIVTQSPTLPTDYREVVPCHNSGGVDGEIGQECLLPGPRTDPDYRAPLLPWQGSAMIVTRLPQGIHDLVDHLCNDKPSREWVHRDPKPTATCLPSEASCYDIGLIGSHPRTSGFTPSSKFLHYTHPTIFLETSCNLESTPQHSRVSNA